MFKRLDAFIYGYLVGLNMNLSSIKNYWGGGGNNNGGYNNSGNFLNDGGGGGGNFLDTSRVDKREKAPGQAGRGGGSYGEIGKPSPIEDNTSYRPGYGGQMYAGGVGAETGQYLMGAGGSTSHTLQESAGGGAGIYGGGSSFGKAGGGGGCGFVVSSDTIEYLLDNSILKNEDYSKWWATSYELIVGDNLGNGYCLVEGKENGKKISERFEYTGEVQYITLQPGTYTITCYGAQGGGINKRVYAEDYDKYSGGYGGTAIGNFTFEEEHTFSIIVGQEGQKGNPVNNTNVHHIFGNGGIGRGYVSYDGGGATIFSWQSNLASDEWWRDYNPMVIAGGGGGIVFCSGDSDEMPDSAYSELYRPSGNYTYNPYKDKVSTKYTYYLVSDQSILHIDYSCVTSTNSESNANYKVYVDDELWFDTTEELPLGAGDINEKLYFNEVLDEDTPAEYKKIDVIIETDVPTTIVDDSINIWIETPLRNTDLNNESIKDYNRPIRGTKSNSIDVDSSFVLTIYEPEPPIYIDIHENILVNDKLYVVISGDTSGDIIIDKASSIVVRSKFSSRELTIEPIYKSLHGSIKVRDKQAIIKRIIESKALVYVNSIVIKDNKLIIKDDRAGDLILDNINKIILNDNVIINITEYTSESLDFKGIMQVVDNNTVVLKDVEHLGIEYSSNIETVNSEKVIKKKDVEHKDDNSKQSMKIGSSFIIKKEDV
jgi:hypothetical protein